MVIGKARTAPTEGTDGSTVNHIGFLVKDLPAMKAKLDAAKIESAPVNGNPKQIMAKFPEKITVELTEDSAIAAPVTMHHIHLGDARPREAARAGTSRRSAPAPERAAISSRHSSPAAKSIRARPTSRRRRPKAARSTTSGSR